MPKLNIFFWTKKKKEQTFAEKIAEALPLLLKVLPDLRKAMRGNVDPEIHTDGKIIGQMYDFYAALGEQLNTVGDAWMGSNESPKEIEDNRILAKPKEVEEELEKIPLPWNLKNLDEKIALLKDKSKLTIQRYVTAQIEGMIKRLENRKGYAEVHDFYEQFPNTTDEKIDALLAKYKLVLNSAELFIPAFPKEAIDVMKKYDEITKKTTGEKAIFYVIAEQQDFEKKQKKLDPILLAQSPFGFYWQILGAWDKEMILLSEL